MSREIKDIKNRITQQLVYPRTHIKAVVIEEGVTLEDILGENILTRIQKLENTIITTGQGDLFLADDGTYKGLDNYLTKVEATNTYTSIAVFDILKEQVQDIASSYINSTQLNNALSSYMTSDLIEEALLEKVDKVAGKQLSTEDFTTDEKNKLETLENYDDTSIKNSISNLETNTASAVSLATFMEGASFVNTLGNIPITYRLVVASVSSDSSLTLESVPSTGREIHIMIHNTSSNDIAITLPDSGNYVNTLDSVMTIGANSYGEINLISDGSIVYIKYI